LARESGLRAADDPVKTTKLIAGFSVSFLAALSVQAQGTFQNLNFEEANPVAAGNPYPAYDVTAASALPGWTVYYGTTQETVVAYNSFSTGAPQVDLVNAANGAIDGNYSVILQGSLPGVSISQTGLIPAGTQSLYFEAEPGLGSLDVLMGTQIVPIGAIGTGSNYTLYGANISAWADDSEQITFAALGDSSEANNWNIDDISFSDVPEPSTVALTAIGGLLFGARKWFARR